MRDSRLCVTMAVVILGPWCSGAQGIRAVRADRPPTIDGKLDDALWETAEPVREFTVLESTRPAEQRTLGYMAYDDSHVYLAMNCLDADPRSIVAKVTKSGEEVFRDDRVEIMLDPGRSRERYYQFVVAAGGGTFEVGRTGGGVYEDDDWKAEWRAATSVNEDGWSVELAVPYCELQITEAPGSAWGVNFCRGKVTPRELSATAAGGMFNEARGFGVVGGIEADFSTY